MPLSIVNVRNTRPTVYVGRKMTKWDGSPLGNPHPVGRPCPICPGHPTHARGEALEPYRYWLVEQMAEGPGNAAHDEIHRIAALVRSGAEVTLGCWCHPEPCHAEIVAEFVRGVLDEPEPPQPEAEDETIRMIVAGSREYDDVEFVCGELDTLLRATCRAGKKLVIVSGLAKGPDTFGKQWAERNGIPVDPHEANWYPNGKAAGYDRSAGYKRNEKMASVADAVIAFWDGQSNGTRHMIEIAAKRGLPVTCFVGRQLLQQQADLLEGLNIRKGDMFAHLDECTMLLVTTNSLVKQNGELVMGRGAALTAKQRWPCLPTLLGGKIRTKCGSRGGEYNLLSAGRVAEGPVVCAFQVKYDWDQAADLGLVKRSAEKLAAYATAHPQEVIFLNFPGIGNGRGSLADIAPLLRCLPKNVTLWMLE